MSHSAAPKVVVSACLTGLPVRYDGAHRSLGDLLSILRGTLELTPFCPEVAAGMGTPRPPVQWVASTSGGLELQRVDAPELHFHHQLHQACQQWCATESQPLAAIVKARSPSCGHGTTPLFDADGNLQSTMDGAFVTALKRRWPTLTLVDESFLQTEDDAHWLCAILRCWGHLQGNSDQSLDTLVHLDQQQRQNWWRARMDSL